MGGGINQEANLDAIITDITDQICCQIPTHLLFLGPFPTIFMAMAMVFIRIHVENVSVPTMHPRLSSLSLERDVS